MKKIAIITGASSGLGKVFFEKVAQRYKDIDEIWLIARREDRLKELAAQFPLRAIRVLLLDLSDTNSFQKLGDILSEQNPDVRVLINNAGYDKAGLFREMSQKDITTLINLNAMGATMISRCCLPYMHEGSYQIITGSHLPISFYTPPISYGFTRSGTTCLRCWLPRRMQPSFCFTSPLSPSTARPLLRCTS